MTRPLPVGTVSGLRRERFALLIRDTWKFDMRRRVWAPDVRCTVPPGQGVSVPQVDAERIFCEGDPRLGEFADFVRVYPVLKRRGSNAVILHHCTPDESYVGDQHGAIQKLDRAWRDGLDLHLLKSGLVHRMTEFEYAAAERTHGEVLMHVRRLVDLKSTVEREQRLRNLIDKGTWMRAAYLDQFTGSAP